MVTNFIRVCYNDLYRIDGYHLHYQYAHIYLTIHNICRYISCVLFCYVFLSITLIQHLAMVTIQRLIISRIPLIVSSVPYPFHAYASFSTVIFALIPEVSLIKFIS